MTIELSKQNLSKKLSWILVILLVCCVTVILAVIFASRAAADKKNNYGTAGVDYVPGQAIVCVNGDTNTLNSITQQCCNDANANVSNTEELMTLQSSAKLQTAIANGDDTSIANLSLSESNEIVAGNVAKTSKSPHIILVDCNNTDAFLSAIDGQDEILWAQPNYICHADGASKNNNSQVSNAEPNDPYLQYQWALDAAAYGGNTESDIDYKTDYPYNTTQDSVIAVVDSGVAYDHPDINMWDEGLNYPTLVAMGGGTYGFNGNTSDTPSQPSSDPYDHVSGHGTHCAGNIGSTTNNSVGDAGVNNHAKIMACRFMDNSGAGSNADAIKCFNYIIAAKQAGVNVTVISNSWGTNPSDLKGLSVEAAIVEAGMNGIISVITSGNEGVSLEGYPNKTHHNPYVIVVGATESAGNRGDYSNYGANTVHVCAPGTMILATANSVMGQYLPWLQSTDDSYFYDDFESESNPKAAMSVTATPAGGQGQTVDATKVNVGSSTSYKNVLQVTMENINYGDTFSMEATIEIPKDQVQAMNAQPYVAMMTSCKNAKVTGAITVGYYNEQGEWIQQDTYNAYDTNMNVVSCPPEDSLYIKGEKIKIGLRCQMVSTSTSKPLFWIDNLGLGKTKCLFAYEDGTSMACPVVAGVAGLVASTTGKHSGAADVLYNEAIVKGSTSHQTSLEGLCQSEGVVNLHRAYTAAQSSSPEQELDPVMQGLSISDDGKTATLSGYFFCDTKGSLTIDGTAASIKSWSNTSISFDVPEGEEHLAKFVLTNSTGKSATRSFEINSGSTKGFVDLPVPNISHDLNGQQINTKDLYPMKSASTQNYFYQVSSLKEPSCAYMERYDYSSGQWQDVDLSGFNIDGDLNMYGFSLAAGVDEVYLLYAEQVASAQDSNASDGASDKRFYLATYSEAKQQWVSKVDVSAYCVLGSIIGVYNGELVLCGYDVAKGLKDSIDIYKIYPDTGKVYGQLPSISVGSVGVNGIVAGNISTYNNKLVITDSLNSVDSNALIKYKQFDYAFTNGPVIFDGQDWHKGDVALYKPSAMQTLVDPSQNFYNIGAACADSSENLCNIIVGPVKNNGTSSMIDTWIYNSSLDSSTDAQVFNDSPWIALSDVRFSSFKNAKVSGAVHNGRFYVMGLQGNNLVMHFRSLDLGLVGLHSKDVELNARHELNGPSSPENFDAASTSSTGDINWLMMAFIELLVGLCISVAIYSRKHASCSTR